MRKALLCLALALMGTAIGFAQQNKKAQFLSSPAMKKGWTLQQMTDSKARETFATLDGKIISQSPARRAEGTCTITLTVEDVWQDGTGYQMLLDPDCQGYSAFYRTGFSEATFSLFEYKIPENATYGLSNVLIGSKATIEIPAGTYDWIVVNPTQEEDGIHGYLPGSGNTKGYGMQFEFVAGNAYEFIVTSDYDGENLSDRINYTINGEAPKEYYYLRPEGTFYSADYYSQGGAYYGYYYLMVPNGVPLTFRNASTDPSETKWMIGGESLDEENIEGDDAVIAYNANIGGYLYPLPYISYGEGETFTLSDGAYFDSRNNYIDFGQEGVYVEREMSLLSLVDGTRGGYYIGYTYPTSTSPAHFGFGGVYPRTIEGETYYPTAIAQLFDKPAAPLYLEEVLMNCYTEKINGAYTGIPAGKRLTMEFRSVNEDGSIGDEVYGTFYATGEDINIKGNFEEDGYDMAYGEIYFYNTTEDEFGGEVLEGIVLNKAFYILIQGLDQEDVDVGFPLIDINENCGSEWITTNPTIQYYNSAESDIKRMSYAKDLLAKTVYTTTFYLYGLMDNVEVMKGYEWTRINETDRIGYTDNPDVLEAIDASVIFLTQTWDAYELIFNDGTGDSDEAPEWLGYEVEEEEEEGEYAAAYVQFYAKTDVPAKVTRRAADGNIIEKDGRRGRYCAVAVKTLTGQSDYMYVIQGDLTHEDVLADLATTTGINTVTTAKGVKSTATYNIMGQKVSNNYRGIVIENGKKMIKK